MRNFLNRVIDRFITEGIPTLAFLVGFIAATTYIIHGQDNPLNIIVLLLLGILAILIYISDQFKKLLEDQQKNY